MSTIPPAGRDPERIPGLARRNPDQILKSLNSLKSRCDADPSTQQLWKAARKLIQDGVPTLVPLLPLFLHLKGKPFTLKRHFPFEPFYNTILPKKVVLKTGRQVSKSTNLAAQGVINSNCIPHFNTLFITPIFEQIRKFSTNYVRGFIEQSPFKKLWTDQATSGNVLQRGFRNHSEMFFSYAFTDADRTRGINASKLVIDEIQDFDIDLLPVIEETLSGSEEWGLEQFAGTPKTMDNSLQVLWEESSQGEWVIPCGACKRDNVPSLSHDLDLMIGPWHEGIGALNPDPALKEVRGVPGTLCANLQCRKPIDPARGRWIHAYPEKLANFAGYHVPQIILPMHYSRSGKWAELVAKQQGRRNTGVNVFYNEVCGESYDTSSKLVSKSELIRAGSLMLPGGNEARAHENKIEHALQVYRDYEYLILVADWGGGGTHGGKNVISWTVFTIMGRKGSGEIDVIYSHRSRTPHDVDREAALGIRLLNLFKPHYFVHDFNGAGRYREQAIINAGYPFERVIPIWYVPSLAQQIMKFVDVSNINARALYRLDKPRSLVLTCSQIRHGNIKFFKYDGNQPDDSGVMDDFLALKEDKLDSRLGRDVYTIIRESNRADDFAHTVNMGACALWELATIAAGQNLWPNLGVTARFAIDEELMQLLSPANPQWD